MKYKPIGWVVEYKHYPAEDWTTAIESANVTEQAAINYLFTSTEWELEVKRGLARCVRVYVEVKS